MVRAGLFRSIVSSLTEWAQGVERQPVARFKEGGLGRIAIAAEVAVTPISVLVETPATSERKIPVPFFASLRSAYRVGSGGMKQPRLQLTFLAASALLAASFNCPAADAPLAAKQAGKGPVKVFVLAGQSNMEGPAVVDIKGINFVITYDPARKADYKAEHDSGVPLDSKYAKERDMDKGQVHFPGSGKTVKDFVIPKGKIINVVSIKYDMTVCDKTDYVFTADTVYEIHTSQANAGAFTSSDIKTIPNNLDKSGGKKYKHSKNANCNLDDRLFNAILAFCEKNHIRTQ